MRRFVLKWGLMMAALILAATVTSMVVHGFTVRFDSLGSAFQLFVGVVALSVLNATLGRLLKFLTIPLNCLTLGLFSLVVNAIVFLIAGHVVSAFVVDNFFSAFIGSILYSLFSSVLNTFLPEKSDRD